MPLSRADRRSDVAAVRKADIDPLVATARKDLETMTSQTVLIGQQHEDRASTAAGTTETQVTAQELARMATELKQTVGGYRA